MTSKVIEKQSSKIFLLSVSPLLSTLILMVVGILI